MVLGKTNNARLVDVKIDRFVLDVEFTEFRIDSSQTLVAALHDGRRLDAALLLFDLDRQKY